MNLTVTQAVKKIEMLDRIVSHMNKLDLFNRMNRIFDEQNIETVDLTILKKINPDAYILWNKLSHRHRRLTSFSIHIVLSN